MEIIYKCPLLCSPDAVMTEEHRKNNKNWADLKTGEKRDATVIILV